MDALDNPYRPGAGTAPPALLGRDDVIDKFGVTIRRTLSGRPGKSVMPIGLRGVGKTVLLNRFEEIAASEEFVCGAIEAPETGDFETLLAVRLRKILLSLERRGPTKAILKALAVLKSFALRLPDGSQISVNVEPLAGMADSGVLSEDVTDLLVAAGEAARSRDSGVFIAIDEVQYLASDELAALIMAVHRTAQLNLPVVVVGAGLPQLPGLAGDAKSYAERLFEFPEIGSLSVDDAVAALAIPADKYGVQFQDAAVRLIAREAHGYPYFLQEWGYHAWNHANSSPITIACGTGWRSTSTSRSAATPSRRSSPSPAPSRMAGGRTRSRT